MNKEFDQIITGKICPYCACETELVLGEAIYPQKLTETPRPKYLDYKFYRCTNNPDHYVGTYKDNQTALGRLADEDLRKAKRNGHAHFDPLWKEGLFENRQSAYDWLAKKMKLPVKYTHFGMFTITQCEEAIELAKRHKKMAKFKFWKKYFWNANRVQSKR